MNHEETISFLNKTSIFSSLAAQDLESLAGLLRSRQSPAEETVIHQGDFGDSIYLIYQGGVDIFIRNQEGAESLVGQLREGDFFGEMALLTGEPRSASVRVTRDAVFLVLYKNDFDRFLKEHPHLALFFSRILAERIRATTVKYVNQVGREKHLNRLLSSGEEQRLTRLIGKTRLFQDIEKRIDEQAGNGNPLMIRGPKGTARAGVARLIHLKGRGYDRPFMVVDLGRGDEWRTYFDRIKSSVKTPGEEAQIFEEFQISTLFGHEQGAMTGTGASRLGHIELADGGTVVLRNIDQLSSGTKEKLNLYLLEKRFYRLGGKDTIASDTRIIATLDSSEDREEARKSLRGKVPELLWDNTIDLPPLVMRRRDIPMIAEFFLEKHALLSGKPIKTISPQALNILVRYSWPGNDRELESVIERGVLVCDGESLLDEHIFLGLTPYTEKGRFNLLHFDSFRHLFASTKLRSVVQTLTVSLLLFVTLLSFLGMQVAGKSLGSSIFWYFMFPYLLLSYVVLGRLYCSISPIAGMFKLFRKLGSKDLPTPKIFSHIGVGLAAFFALGFLWFEAVAGIREIPYRTAAFVVSLSSTAILVNFVFKQEAWCRYLCPMGYLGGLFSCLTPVELRANNNVCTSQCKTTYCYKRDGKKAGCPMGLFPVSLASNQFCIMCGTCVYNCQYKSIHLDLRWPGAELWGNKEPNIVTSLSIPALLGSLYPLILHYGHGLMSSWYLFTGWFLVCAVLSVALFTGASFAGGRQSFRSALSSYGFVYLPLTFAGHIAFQVPFMQDGWRWLAGTIVKGGIFNSSPIWVQTVLIGIGSIWSLWVLRKLSTKETRLITVAHGILVIVFGISLFLTF